MACLSLKHVAGVNFVVLAMLTFFAPIQTSADDSKAREITAKNKGQFHFVDLAKRTNQELSEDFHGYEGNNLKPLPRGKQTFAEIPFHVGDGMIQLAGKRAPEWPEAVEGIPVGKKATHIHFLHGTGWGSPGVADGTVLGHYTVNYEDETSKQIPIVYGEDLRDWWQLADTSLATRAETAWTGVNDASKDFRGQRVKLRLFVRSWENPNPDVKIGSIDFVSLNNTVSSPFNIAITVENRIDEKEAIKTLRQHKAFVGMGDDDQAIAVTLSTGRVNDETLTLLSNLPHLQKLDLSNNRLNNKAWEQLSQLSGVRLLSLNRTNTTDAVLATLTDWSELERLWLYDTDITDAGLKHLSTLTNLKELDLSKTAITDAGIEQLSSLEQLKKLDLRQTKVTQNGVEQLKEKLPMCQIKD